MNIKSLTSTARDRLSAASYSPNRLALLHTGAAVALAVILTLINYLLTRQMENTAGLSGIGTRTILLSVQTGLTIAGAAAMPFWECGFRRAALLLSRAQPATPNALLEGFRRFGVVLRTNLLRTAACLILAFFCLQAATTIFLMTPMSEPFMEAAMAVMESGVAVDDAAATQLMPTLTWVYVIWAVLAGIVLLPLLYRYRMADWAIMDETDRALKAFRESKRLMFRRRAQLLRLDLHFWWYYALQVVATAVAYGDILLPAFGVTVDPNVAFFGFVLISQLAQLLLAWRFAPLVNTTYAAAYNEFRTLADKQFTFVNGELRVES